MSAGRLIGVVGPSGVGKDSVMRALAAARPGIHVVRRVITRAGEAGGEDHDRVSAQEFERLRAAGAFALHWCAHGMRYGIPAEVAGRVAGGAICLVNLSRSVLGEAEHRFPGFVTLHLTAPSRVLAVRLRDRGRENAEQIAARLARAPHALPGGLSRVVRVENDGPLEDTVQACLAALQIERG